nr:reverse transcriptase domain-containing protein [Tanacetum cinerariifolium]
IHRRHGYQNQDGAGLTQGNRGNTIDRQKGKHEAEPKEVLVWNERRQIFRIHSDIRGDQGKSKKKSKAIINMPSPSNLKQMKSLSGKLAALNRFVSKGAERVIPCLDMLKKCTNKKDFWRTLTAKEVFQAMKKLIAKLPTLIALMKDEELMVYLSATSKAVSVVLLVK